MKIVLLEPLGIDADTLEQWKSQLQELGHNLVSYETRETDVDILIERSKDADIVILTNLPYPKDVMEACPKLKMIAVAFTGVDHVDMAYCKERQIVVSNAAGYSTSAVAELAVGLMIGVYRRLIECDRHTRQSKTKAGLIGFELSGKTVGIIGTGAIGWQVMRILQAFGCEVIAYSRTQKQTWIDAGVAYVDKETLLRTSDIVTLHVPLTESSRGLIGKEELAWMKPSAILINTARGPVVDSEALAEALENGQIAGAGIDVFEIEPPIPSEHGLMQAPNTLVTPHVAFATKEALLKRAKITFDNVESYIEGEIKRQVI